MEQVTLDEAAARLGLSRAAVRKRAQRGTLSARKVDGQWVVFLPDIPTPGHPGDDGPPTPEVGRTAMDSALVDKLRGHVATLERQIDVKDRQIGELHVLLQQSQARALPPAAETFPPAGESGDDAPAGDVDPEPRRRWWQRRRR
jgi:hypothetical protein